MADQSENKFDPKDVGLFRAIDEILYYQWDPIRVNDTPEARDEYYSYCQDVFSLLTKGASEVAIAEYLVKIEGDNMGLTPKPERAREVAGLLVDAKDCIFDDDSSIENRNNSFYLYMKQALDKD